MTSRIARPNAGSHLAVAGQWEQDALWGLMDGDLKSIFERHVCLVDEMMFEERTGQFLRHIGSSEDKASATDSVGWLSGLP